MTNTKKIFIGVTAVVVLAFFVMCFTGLFDKNDDQNWQVWQGLSGQVDIINEPGWYWKNFGTVTTYPRAVQRYFSQSVDEGGIKDESVRVTFNDGGTAYISTMIRYQTPTIKDKQRKFHRDFSGLIANANESVRAHLINCLKNTAPLMSASEHQSARKSEFAQVVEDQMRDGIYKMRRVARQLKDKTDIKGKAITVYATEIIRSKDGKPIIAQPSPLTTYGIIILQFSVTLTEYDNATKKQFAAKQQSYLKAEEMKASRQEQVESRLMIIEKGLKDKAQAEAEGNVVKIKAVIAAEQKAEVAEQVKREAETKANQLLSVEKIAKKQAETTANKALAVAKIQKTEAETMANRDLEVAKIQAAAATENSRAMIIIAKAEQERIKIAGAITEREKTLAMLAKDRDVEVAAKLAQIAVPVVVITGQGGSGGSSLMENMINLRLLQGSGLLDPALNFKVPKAIDSQANQTK